MKKDLFQQKGIQTVSKHSIFENYLEPWVKIISNRPWVKDAYYVDAFAGTGKYKTGEMGSPVIAANILLKYQKPTCKLHCICIERDSKRYNILENSLKQSEEKLDIRKHRGEFLTYIDTILKKINKSPAFFFIDPEGFSGVGFDKIEAILNLPHKEILINFQYNAIQRWLKAPKVESTITKLFGTSDYKKAKKEKDLIKLYKEQIKQTGAFVWDFRNKFPKKNRTFYYLVYATKNITGFKIMKDVMFSEQSRRYFEPSLFAEVDFQTFQKEIFSKYKRKKFIEYNEVLGFVLQETDYLAKDLEKVLKNIGAEKIENPRQKHNPFLTFPKHNSDSLLLKESTSHKYENTLLEVPVIINKKVKINYKEYNLIDETKRLLVSHVNDGSIITRFDKTPLPKKLTDVICPHFLELKWAYGCPYNCAWCYLKGTFRFHNGKILPGFKVKDYDKTRLHVEEFLEKVDEPEILNTGEIADSLMYENGTSAFSKFIIPMFERRKKHKVLFVTKSDRIKNLLEINPHDQVIVSFSLNAIPVAEKWEKGAPGVVNRIEAAKKLSKENYEIRIRIDPLVPIENWQGCYKELIDLIFLNFIPERITFGSLRGLQSTLNGTKDNSWKKYLKESSSWGKKVDFTTRLKMYLDIISYLKKKYKYDKIALCKETKAMWQKLGMDYREIKCNCIW
ncbi:three-Cys-motif partner protein TcmP [bacterium]|nr:three-Cys-motif partner protein TcmP [bacterium]